MNILDEHSRECLVFRVKRKLNSTDVIDALTNLFILRGVLAYIRSDNGPEFVAEVVRNWIHAMDRMLRVDFNKVDTSAWSDQWSRAVAK